MTTYGFEFGGSTFNKMTLIFPNFNFCNNFARQSVPQKKSSCRLSEKLVLDHQELTSSIFIRSVIYLGDFCVFRVIFNHFYFLFVSKRVDRGFLWVAFQAGMVPARKATIMTTMIIGKTLLIVNLKRSKVGKTSRKPPGHAQQYWQLYR